jgi:hypothetical protein
MTSKSRLLSSVVNKPESLIGASLSQPNEVNLQALETAATQYTDVTTLPASGYVGEQAFVASTNRLYIWTGTGWFNIALVNTDPTISSAGAANYTMSYGTPITVNVDASDPEGLGLSYSYYTSDSIGSIATITNDSSQFTITPSSDYSVEGSFGLVFRASDGPNIASSSSSTFTLTNQSPSLSGNSSSYVLATDGSTPTVITLTSVDPEGQPITYTATGDTGFNAIATVSNDSSVFTITPKSEDSAVTGTGTLTFTANDGVKSTNGTSSFSLTFISIIENSKYTTLLATATDTSDNNNITDASSNNHSITVNGDAHAGTFSPYRSGGYSGLLDSTSVVQLSFAGSSGFEFGTGNFTIEMWFKWNSSSKPQTTIFSNRISGSTFDTGKYFLKLMPGDSTSGGIEFAFDCGAPRYRLYCVDNLTADDAFFDEGWHHYSAVRNGTSLKLFVDGQEVDEITLPANETNFGNSSDNIGLGINNSVSSPSGPDGEYRDVRIVKGVAIIPPSGGPTEPLEAVSGTTLLLYNGESYTKDKSTSNHSPIYGSTVPTITATGPYDYTEYSATDHGGSVYFDDTGDSLTFSEIDFGTGDFCIEGWFNRSDSSDGTVVSGFGNPTDNLSFIRFGKDSANTISMYFQGSWVFRGVSVGGELGAGNWFHYVVTRSGTAIKAFVNGKLITTASSSEDVNITAVGFDHQNGGNFFNGYVSDLRVNTSIPTEYQTSSTTHGSSIFTPPTAPLSSSGASLHLKGTDASIIDKSQGANLKLEGNTTGSTTQAKFSNTKSMYFDGTGDYIPVITDFFYEKNTSNASTTKFTIETWVYHTARLTYSGYNHIFQTIVGLGNVGMSFGIGPSGNLKFYHQSASTNVVSSTSTISLNTWTHIAVIVDGSQGSNGVTLKINGSTDGTGSWNGISTSQSDQSLPFSSPHFTIGRYPDTFASHQQFEGYLQDLRISNIARTITSAPTASLEG